LTTKKTNLIIAFLVKSCYYYITTKPADAGRKGETAMTTGATDNRSRAELMDLIRDAALIGDLSTADIYELAEYARRLTRESVGTPEAETA
jgi:hypothetical protein